MITNLKFKCTYFYIFHRFFFVKCLFCWFSVLFCIFCQIRMHLLLASIILLHKIQLFDITTNTRTSASPVDDRYRKVSDCGCRLCWRMWRGSMRSHGQIIFKFWIDLPCNTCIKKCIIHVLTIFSAYFSAYYSVFKVYYSPEPW